MRDAFLIQAPLPGRQFYAILTLGGAALRPGLLASAPLARNICVSKTAFQGGVG